MSPKQNKVPPQCGWSHYLESAFQAVALELLIRWRVSSINTVQVCLPGFNKGVWGELETLWDINVVTL